MASFCQKTLKPVSKYVEDFSKYSNKLKKLKFFLIIYRKNFDNCILIFPKTQKIA